LNFTLIEVAPPKTYNGKKLRNIVSVSWTDHLVFGEDNGGLKTVDALGRRMKKWQTELGAGILHWRCTRDRIKGRFNAGNGYRHFFKTKKSAIDWDDFKVVPQLAHELGLEVYLYVSLFDEGWPLAPKRIRAKSYHNKMHGQHFSWQSDFSKTHSDDVVVDRTLKNRQWGVMCLGNPGVREHFINRYRRLLASGDFDGLYVCLRSQSKPADFADQYGFNEPIRQEYLNRHSKDIWIEDFDLKLWRDLLGDYLTVFLTELRNAIRDSGIMIAVGVPRGNILGPPLGNTTLQWPKWVQDGIIDHLIIDQNSSKCPSMWHELWPMHRGYGYLENYLNGYGMKTLEEDLSRTYGPILDGNPAELFIARQWQNRSDEQEKDLLKHPSVQGLVFSSFRHDNPGPICRNDWSV